MTHIKINDDMIQINIKKINIKKSHMYTRHVLKDSY